MSKATTVEKNNRFYKQHNGEILTENELLKEWLMIANKENERLHSIIKEVREYIKENEKEYGSLEDNEKIILGILDKEKE